jgi:F420H(2)-dependent quinone reductase
MRFGRILGGIAALAVALGIFYVVLAESGEVVVLETRDAAGAHDTRLWVVDHDGAAWLRTGDPTSPWLARIRANPDVAVTRGGERHEYRAVLVEDAATRDQINALTLEKYGWRERALRSGMDPSGVTPIRLDPR